MERDKMMVSVDDQEQIAPELKMNTPDSLLDQSFFIPEIESVSNQKKLVLEPSTTEASKKVKVYANSGAGGHSNLRSSTRRLKRSCAISYGGRLCKEFTESGEERVCIRGLHCPMAHGYKELELWEVSPEMYKTKQCAYFKSNQFCNLGFACPNIHGHETTCQLYRETGKCYFPEMCPYETHPPQTPPAAPYKPGQARWIRSLRRQ